MTASVSLGYRGHQIVVEAEDERVIRRVGRSFRELAAVDPCRSRDVLRVQRAGGQFELLCGGERVFAHEELWEVATRVRHEIIGGFVRAHPELLWLHAGAAVRDGKAVLFVGAYGRGKSTLVTQLCLRGWEYVSDDIVPVDLTSGWILPFPMTPIVREDVGTELPRERLTEIRKVKVSLPRSAIRREPVPIGGIVLPTYRSGIAVQMERYSAAAVALDIVRAGMNSEANAVDTVALCARLARDVPIVCLTYSNPRAATDLIMDELCRRQGGPDVYAGCAAASE